MQVHVLRVPPDFMPVATKDESTQAIDPFSPSPPAPVEGMFSPRLSSREVLQSAGITFPQGSSSFWESSTGMLTLRNSVPNIELATTYVEELHKQTPKTVRFLLRVIEAPNARLRGLSSSADVKEAVDKLVAEASEGRSQTRVVQTALIENPSGKRATHECITEHAFCTGIEWDAKRRLSVPYERRAAGFIVEMEPVIQADGRTVESRVHLALDDGLKKEDAIKLTEPVSGQQVAFPVPQWQVAHLRTSAVILDVMTRLIGILPRPAGGQPEDETLSWAVFLTAHVVPALESPAAEAKPAKLTPEMMSVIREVPPGLLEMAEIPPRTPAIEKYFQQTADEQEREAVKKANLDPVNLFLLRQGIPHEKGSRFEFKDNGLHVKNTPENIERIDAMLEELAQKAPKASQFLVEVVEAGEPFWEKLAAQAVKAGHHEAQWQKVEAAISGGEAVRLESIWLEGAEDARFFSGRDHAYLNGLNLDAKDRSSLLIDRQLIGSELRLNLSREPESGPTWTGFRLERATAPETLRRGHFRNAEPPRDFELPLTDFHRALITRDFSIQDGSVRFLGFWRPAGRPELKSQKRCHAAFFRCRQVLQVPPAETLHWLRPNEAASREKLETRTYRVPLELLNKPAPKPFRRSKASEEPFAIQVSEMDSVGDWFMASGIFHIEGASSSYSAETNMLYIRNTPENLSLIEQFLAALLREETRAIGLTLHILEAPTAEVRNRTAACLDMGDHYLVMESLIHSGNAREITIASVEGKLGDPVSIHQADSRIHLRTLSIKPDGSPDIVTEERESGLLFEATPELDAVSEIVKVKLKLQKELAEPRVHQEKVMDIQTGKTIEVPLTDFEQMELTTTVTMPLGSTRLLAVWDPKSGGDNLRMAFLTCTAASSPR